MVTRLTAVAAVAVAAGCYAPTFKDCELACAAGMMCPDGYECQGQVCRPNGTMPGLACPGGGMPDAPEDSSSMIDAPVGLHPSGPWGAALPVYTVGTGVDDPSLTPDRLEMYVGLGTDIRLVTRTSDTAPWGPIQTPNPPGILNSAVASDYDDAAYISSDALTMHWMSSRPPNFGGNDIWRATRPNRNGPWELPVRVDELSSPMLDAGGSISSDGLVIVFASQRGGAGMLGDLYLATRGSLTSTWTNIQPMTGLNTAADESHPILSPDKLAIYFHSNRAGGAGDYDLYEAHRTSISQAFGGLRPLTELNTAAYEGDPWVSPDGQHMFYTGVSGGAKAIFETSR